MRAFPVVYSDQLLMFADAGHIILCPMDQISGIGRSARGVTEFKVADEERLVSVSRFRDLDDNGDEDLDDVDDLDVEDGETEASAGDAEDVPEGDAQETTDEDGEADSDGEQS